MTVASILGHKSGATIYTCHPDDTIRSVAEELSKHRIGAIFVVDEKGALVGIISERDIVRLIARDGEKALSELVSDAMTRNVATCLPSDTVTMLMGLLTENRVRHIPVVVDGEIQGVVSIGDVVKARIAAAEREAAEMMQYISSGI